MIRAGLAAFLAASPGAALALSCQPPDVARDYLMAQASEDVYVVVEGHLSFDRTVPVPGSDPNAQVPPPTWTIAARRSAPPTSWPTG